jgi:RNA polymerase sigma-70 factor (ECF subfamily)
LAAREALDAALERIAALPADQAQVVLLRVLGDLSLEDTAKILGKRAGTIGVLQHRALRKLAAQEKSDEV